MTVTGRRGAGAGGWSRWRWPSAPAAEGPAGGARAARARMPVERPRRACAERGRGADSWTAPRRRVDNTRLRDLGVSRLFRTEDSGQGEPQAGDAASTIGSSATRRSPASSWRAAPAPIRAARRFTFTDRSLTLGRRYTYVVAHRPTAQGRTSPPSRRLSLAFIAAPEAPEDVRAVPRRPRGAPVLASARQAHRRRSGRDAADLRGPARNRTRRPPRRGGRTEPGVTTALDGKLENDRVYYYAIRSVRRDGVATAEG